MNFSALIVSMQPSLLITDLIIQDSAESVMLNLIKQCNVRGAFRWLKQPKKENAHDIAKKIHSLILQSFTSETVVRLDADVDEHMTAEKNEEEIEDNSTEDEKTCDDENIIWLSTFCRIMESNLQTGTCHRLNELNLII